MRIIVEHRTHYRFTDPQTRLVQLLRMTPDDTDDQTVVAWSIDVDCDARLRESRDGLGNRQTMLYADGPLTGIEISVRGEVLTSDSGGRVSGAVEPLPPAFFLRETERTQAGAALSRFVADMVGDGPGTLEALARVNRAFAGRFRLIAGEGLRDAAAAFDGEDASPRELAQMMVAGLHAAGVPARYVGGYRQHAGQACAPHGWVEAYVDDAGWYAFDPSRGEIVGDQYVRVAVGLDTASAAPVAGSRLGAGEETLDVALTVAQAGNQG